MQGEYMARLGPLGEPTPDGIGGAQTANTRPVKIVGPEGEVYSGRSADNVAALDKRVKQAGFDRIGDWVDGAAPLERMNWLRRNRLRISIPLVSLLFMSGCVASIALDQDEPEEITGVNARIDCEGRVKEQLRDPNSAEFTNQTESGGGYTWRSQGIVSADNLVGGSVAGDYTCEATYNPDEGSWTGTVEIEERQ